MATDAMIQGAERRSAELAGRLVAGEPSFLMAGSAKAWFRDIQTYLLDASNARLIDDSPARIREVLKLAELDRRGPESVDFNASGGHGQYKFMKVSVGKGVNFARDPEQGIRRNGSTWFHFGTIIREPRRGAEKAVIIAYHFEICNIPGHEGSFFRLDLNAPAHANERLGLRSHMHLNSDDDGFSVPAPIMSPLEILDLFLHRLKPLGKSRTKS